MPYTLAYVSKASASRDIDKNRTTTLRSQEKERWRIIPTAERKEKTHYILILKRKKRPRRFAIVTASKKNRRPIVLIVHCKHHFIGFTFSISLALNRLWPISRLPSTVREMRYPPLNQKEHLRVLKSRLIRIKLNRTKTSTSTVWTKASGTSSLLAAPKALIYSPGEMKLRRSLQLVSKSM